MPTQPKLYVVKGWHVEGTPPFSRKTALFDQDKREFPNLVSVSSEDAPDSPDEVIITIQMRIRRDEVAVLDTRPA